MLPSRDADFHCNTNADFCQDLNADSDAVQMQIFVCVRCRSTGRSDAMRVPMCTYVRAGPGDKKKAPVKGPKDCEEKRSNPTVTN